MLISLPQLVGLLLGELLRRYVTNYISIASEILLKGGLDMHNLLRSAASVGVLGKDGVLAEQRTWHCWDQQWPMSEEHWALHPRTCLLAQC